MRFSRVVRALMALCAAVSAVVAAHAAVEHDYTLTLAAGHDSNPLRLTDGGRDGSFLDLRVAGAVGVELSPRVEWSVAGTLGQRLHGPDAGDADSEDARVVVGLELASATRRTVVAFGAAYDLQRSTFTDRETGEPYTIAADPPTVPPTPVAIPERFDTAARGLFLDVRWRASRRLHPFVESELEHVDYLTDYSDRTSLRSLDHRTVSVEPGLAVTLHRQVALRLSAAIRDQEFDDRPALDDTGQEVPGERRNYRHHDYRLALRVAPTGNLRLDIGHRSGGRDDTHAGYYSYGSLLNYVGLEHRAGWRNRLRATASMRRVDYDNAVVPNSPEGDLRGSRSNRFTARFERRLRERVEFFVEGGTEKITSQDPVFSHDRDWMFGGIRYSR